MNLTTSLRLHQVGYVVHDIEPLAKDYVGRYGYRTIPSIIHDPQQTAMVQFLQLMETGAIWS
jgi:hypothetical protein